MLTVSEAWKEAYPGAAVGIVAMRNVVNPERHPALDQLKGELEKQHQARFADRGQLKVLKTIQAYNAYYKQFKQNCHGQLQLESVALKGKPIPRVAALVVAELKNQLLTAGDDLDAVQPPVRLDVAKGDERCIRLNGQAVKPGDMFIADAQGILSSILYGPDQRTQILPTTQSVLYPVYAPRDIEEQAVYEHLQDMEANIRLIAPHAETEQLLVYGTG
jgi:DNA/RNA-binding domain of Phe-tRNA-synthetase-like protein